MTNPIRLLIVDDHPVVRDGLRAILATQPDLQIIGEADTGDDAVARVIADPPDVVLMDLQMPGLDGVTATRSIRAAQPLVRVLVLTTHDTDADITAAIEAGATGYLLKDTPRADLFAAIRAAARGESTLSPAVATRLLGRLRGSADALAAREIEVLTAVARGHGNKQVAKALHISEATVKTHLLHISPSWASPIGPRRHHRPVPRHHPPGLVPADSRRG